MREKELVRTIWWETVLVVPSIPGIYILKHPTHRYLLSLTCECLGLTGLI